ncbi:MAG TPA: DUF2851 family protein [Dehalococcoidia bacterium]|nr:DUF2851 family protein [Dehalococcoidia bacterium]
MTAAAAPRLTEKQLSELWRGRRFPSGALVTRSGVPVTVISPGRAGRGPGPDFRGAVIAGPSRLPVRGDVELHVRSSSFRAHGHERDPAYAGVVLHVVFEDDTGEDTPLPGGRTAPVVALAPWVARRAGELERWLAQPALWREPCHDAVARLGLPAVLAALDAAGDARVAARVARFAEDAAGDGPPQALYAGLLEALGYGGNAAPMRELARRLPWRLLAGLAGEDDDRARRMESLLLAAAGLAPGAAGTALPPGVAPLAPSAWKRSGVRPANQPARRIAAAAVLLASAGPEGLLACTDAASAGEAIAALRAASGGRIGRARAVEVLVNVVLPAAAASGEPARIAGAAALWAALPRPAAYGVTRFLEAALASHGTRPPMNARRAQGLLALHRDWCARDGCGRCPLS